MAAVFYVAGNPAGSSTFSTADLSIGRPTGVVEGDVLLLFVWNDDGVAASSSGFSSLLFDESTGVRCTVLTKTAGASEPSTYTVTFSGSCRKGMLITAYRNAKLPAGDSTSADTGGGTASSLALPSVTTFFDGMIVGGWGTGGDTSGMAVPGSMTFAVQRTTGAVGDHIVGYESVGSGTSGTRTGTWADNRTAAGALVSLESNNAAPNAPTLTSPVGGATVDRTAAILLQGTFSDPDAGDQLSEVTVEYRQVSGSTISVTQAASGSTFTVTITAGALTAGNYEWRAKTKDAAGLEGPFSSWAPFTAAAPPVAPVITAPVGTIGVDPSLTEWTAPNQDAFQVQVTSEAGGSGTLHHDSGTVVSGARAYSTPRPVTGRTEYTRVRVRFAGLWSPWTETSNAVAYTPPEVPTVTLVEEGAAILVDVGNPTGDTPTVSNEIRRQQSVDGTVWTDESGTVDGYNTVARGVDPDGSWRDWQVANNVEYRYDAVAVGDNGTKTVAGLIDYPEGPAATPDPGGGGTPPAFVDSGAIVYRLDGTSTWLPLSGATLTEGQQFAIGFIVNYGSGGTRSTSLSEAGTGGSGDTSGSVMEWWTGDPDAGGTLLRDDDYFAAYDAKPSAGLFTTAELGGVGTPAITARAIYPSGPTNDHVATFTIQASGESVLASGFTRESLLDERAGFGVAAGGTGTGNADDALLWDEYVVTNSNANATGPGTLKDALASGERWITFQSSLTIATTISSTITLPSRVVIDGRGASVTLTGNSAGVLDTDFGGTARSNLIIAYLSFVMASTASSGTDLIQLSGVTNAWVHHCTFTGNGPSDETHGDGWLDIAHQSDGSESTLVTVSLCKFDSCNKTSLAGSGQNVAGDGTVKTNKGKLTYYNNLWRNCRQRHPLAKNSLLDFVGNWVDGWGVSGSGQCVQLQNSAEGYLRNNIFDATFRTAAVTQLSGGVTSVYAKNGGGNLLTGSAAITEIDATDVFDPATYYSLTPPTANQAHRDFLDANAGNVPVTP